MYLPLSLAYRRPSSELVAPPGAACAIPGRQHLAPLPLLQVDSVHLQLPWGLPMRKSRENGDLDPEDHRAIDLAATLLFRCSWNTVVLWRPGCAIQTTWPLNFKGGQLF